MEIGFVMVVVKNFIFFQMNLKKLHEQFINNANRSMTFGKLPINAKEKNSPIVVTNKWEINDKVLTKIFQFQRKGDKNKFVIALLEYETEIEHNAIILINEDTVTLELFTKNLDKVTELDKEYAKYADVLFKDVAYNPGYEQFKF